MDCVTRMSYGGRLGGLRGLGVPWFSLRGGRWWGVLS